MPGEMPRRPRLATGGIAYHVLNRRVSRLPLFEKPGDYHAFETVLGEAFERTKIRIAAYCLMPNHWHLLLWARGCPFDSEYRISKIAKQLGIESTMRSRGRPLASSFRKEDSLSESFILRSVTVRKE